MPKVIKKEDGTKKYLKTDTADVEFSKEHDEAGTIYDITCPNCGDRVWWSAYMWTPNNVCSCGLHWIVSVEAHAY